MGFIHTEELMARLDGTPSLHDVREADFDAIVVCGGQAPMFWPSSMRQRSPPPPSATACAHCWTCISPTGRC